ncbi:MAG: hypothetical protein PHS41_07130 [Victivallaceae bacterium]|nr:hypothetical protein [Victivallaceae bacterium]
MKNAKQTIRRWCPRWLLLPLLAFLLLAPTQGDAFVDPVTLAILTPIAIKAAETAAPYVARGLASGAKGLVLMGKDTLEILYLPLGVLQSTLLLPFGGFSSGMGNIGKGVIAPFKLMLDALLLPVRFCGIATS